MKLKRIRTLDNLAAGAELMVRLNGKSAGSTIHGHYGGYQYSDHALVLTLREAVQIPVKLPFSETQLESPESCVQFMRDLYHQLTPDAHRGLIVNEEMQIKLPRKEDLGETRACYLVQILDDSYIKP